MIVTINDFDLRTTFNIERKILSFPGYYPKGNIEQNSVFTMVISVATTMISLGQLFSMIMQIFVARHDLSKLSETLLYFTTHVTYMCKLANFGYHRSKILHIENLLTRSQFYGFANTQLKKVQQRVASTKMVGKTFQILCGVCVFAWGLVPYFDHTKAHSLPLPGWLPYDTTKYYYPTFVFQMVALFITACLNSTIDILTWMLVTLASAQFDILKENLKNIDYKCELLTIELEFKTCVKHHKEIVNFVHKIEHTFSKGILLQFFASVIVICFTGFSIMIVPLFSMQFGYLLFYFLCMMTQVGMYCWYGHDVMTTSNEIGQYFHMSNWYESDIRVRPDLMVFLERIKKPVTLTAGGFITLSLTTLVRILRSSYSYFAVLQHLYNNS